MRVICMMVALLSLAFGTAQAQAITIDNIEPVALSATDNADQPSSILEEPIQQAVSVIAGFKVKEPVAGQPASRVGQILGEAGKVAPPGLAVRLKKLTQSVASRLLDMSARPLFAVWTRSNEVLTAKVSKKDTDESAFAMVTAAKNAVLAISQLAYERKVRDFLIHDWPSPGILPAYGSKQGDAVALGAEAYDSAMDVAVLSLQDEGGLGLLTSPASEGFELLEVEEGLPDYEIFDQIACSLTGTGEQDCPGADDILGRMPSGSESSAPSAFNQTGPSGGPFQKDVAVAQGQSPLALVGAVAPFIDFSGGNSGGSGGGASRALFEKAEAANDPTPPPVVPLPGSLPLLLVGGAVFVMMRRKAAA